jgi:hypothetical protein
LFYFFGWCGGIWVSIVVVVVEEEGRGRPKGELVWGKKNEVEGNRVIIECAGWKPGRSIVVGRKKVE